MWLIQKHIHSTSCQQVMKGRGIKTARNKSLESAIDSGSNIYITSIRKSDNAFIDIHKRLHSRMWKTSNGIFETIKLVTC